MFDYAKAYLLYDLISTNRIEFKGDIPEVIKKIMPKGRVKELKPTNIVENSTTEE